MSSVPLDFAPSLSMNSVLGGGMNQAKVRRVKRGVRQGARRGSYGRRAQDEERDDQTA